MISFLNGLRDGIESGSLNGAIASRANVFAGRLMRMSWLGLAGASLSIPAAIAQPIVQPVSQIPVPAPQSRSVSVGSEAEPSLAESTQAGLGQPPLGGAADVLAGEPLAMPGDRIPVGNWTGRAGVKDIALAEMPWMGRGGYVATIPSTPAWSQSWSKPWTQAPPLQAQYQVVVATPSPGHAEALKQVVPAAIALQASSGAVPSSRVQMQAGAFVDWRRANALRRALQAYGFSVEVQGLESLGN